MVFLKTILISQGPMSLFGKFSEQIQESLPLYLRNNYITCNGLKSIEKMLRCLEYTLK